MPDMMPTCHGKHLIAGEWVANHQSFESDPAHGLSQRFSKGTIALVDQACEAAEDAFWSYGYSSRETRAAFLDAIAEEIEARGPAITDIGSAETGLPRARLDGERGRTTGQLRLFATHIRQGDYLDRRHDPALPDRQPLPRPELYMMQRPVGPVAIFGASNFPLAFSVAGGDTAAALAAGCPVVVRGHPAHPGTGEIVAEAIHAAIARTGVPSGVFSLIQGGEHDVGQAVVQNPKIKAVGFTGSFTGGRALFNLCAQRPEPIPFFGELGSVNPMFLLPQATRARAEELGKGWADSLALGAGQFCTNPGIAIVLEGSPADRFSEAARAVLAEAAPQTMLSDGIANAYRAGIERVSTHQGVQTLLDAPCNNRAVRPALFRVSAEIWLANPILSEEVFGPLGLIVTAKDGAQMKQIAQGFKGQLTATLHMQHDDTALAQDLMPILERMAGRILVNGFPTGVEVSDAMVHGGPYPASTNFGATSVGTLSIRRFLRPVCYQNLGADLLPRDLA